MSIVDALRVIDLEEAQARIAKLETALLSIADGTVPAYLAASDAFELERTDDLEPCIRALQEFARSAIRDTSS